MEIGSFAWLVPFALASFGGVFLVLRLNGVGSFWWAAAFLFAGAAFVMSLVAPEPDAVLKPVLEDAFFVFAFASYTAGTARRFEARLAWTPVLAAVALGIGGAWLALALSGSVRAELIAIHASAILLLVQAARIIRSHARHVPDHCLFWLSVGVAGNLLLQSIALAAIADPTLKVENWSTSVWGFTLLASGATVGTLLAAGVLVAVGRDIIEALHQASTRDPLTGILNRRGFDERCAELLVRAAPTRRGCLVIADIDHFKAVNDAHGHSVGDAVICAMASLLETGAGERAAVARLGGEEFALFLPGADLSQARTGAEQLKRAFATIDWPTPLGGTRLTASFGVTDLSPDETLAAATGRADQMLYYAKRGGRDAVCWCSSASRVVPADETGIGHAGGLYRPAPVSAVA